MNPLKQQVNPLMLPEGKRGFIGIKIRVYRQIKTVFLIPDVSKIRSFVLSGKLHGIWFFNGIVITAGARRE